MESLGRYDVVRKIGEGGFGEVYEGYDPHLRRRVAIKTCSSDAESHRSRFAQEAALAGSLHHRNLTATYDFSSTDDLSYVVQEFLEGEDLDQIIARRDDISVSTKLLYLIQLARGLRHVHSNGVVHRDVKPSNIRILPTGQVKLMDFGIAQSMDAQNQETLAGETFGTAAYLAPEQIRGEHIDERSDIYSFGVTAYELLSLERPFPGDIANDVLGAVMTEEPLALTEHWEDCPEALAALVHRCMERDPDQRYDGMDAVLRDFDQILGHDSGQRSVPVADPTDPTDPTMLLQAGVPSPLRAAAPQTASADREEAATMVLGTDPPVQNPALLRHSEVTPLVMEPSQARGPSLLNYLIGLALMGILGAGAASLYFGAERDDPAVEPDPTATTETREPPLSSAEAEPIEQPDPMSGTEVSAAPFPAVEKTGTLVLETAWSPELEARVNGTTLKLNQQRTLDLPVGSHAVTFRLDDDPATGWNESQIERQQVEIVEDQRSTLATSLQPPGALTVRAALGAPQAFIRVDGDPLGWAPVNEQVIPPGNYQVTASASPTDEDPRKSYALMVNSGEITVITFDIDGPEEPLSTVKEWTP